jgi:hypothetical protein
MNLNADVVQLKVFLDSFLRGLLEEIFLRPEIF